MNNFLSEEEKRELLIIARKSLEYYFSGSSIELNRSGRLGEQHGMFVTLKKSGVLRGCIGYIRGYKPLSEQAYELARKSAFEDPRFPSVQEEELEDIEIEISVLTPFEIIAPEDIIIGEHGLYIVSGTNSGLLLPQVATEWGFDREKFLDALCEKAWLPKDFWRNGDYKLYAFKAIIFSERG